MRAPSPEQWPSLNTDSCEKEVGSEAVEIHSYQRDEEGCAVKDGELEVLMRI